MMPRLPREWRETAGKIRHHRRVQEHSVDWLATATGLTRQQVIHIEAGLVGATSEQLAAIAAALGVDVAALLEREPRLPAIWWEIGSRVRHCRRSQGKSVDWLAKAVGVSRVQIVRIEAGLVGTTIERIYMMADALGVSADDLQPPRTVAVGDPVREMLIGRGLLDAEIKQVTDYIDLIKRERGHRGHDE